MLEERKLAWGSEFTLCHCRLARGKAVCGEMNKHGLKNTLTPHRHGAAGKGECEVAERSQGLKITILTD